ncbi:hypothetical protein HZC53_05970 [Candidatus Uhrbacteria bacterium]|nr:hypothetical protein [Candidatus Uhrbacteria bacterium]
MEVTKRFMAFAAFLLLLLFGVSARAQSDVRTPDQKIYFRQMDPVLTGMWMGNGGDDGMRYDAEAIACMVRACADIQATVPPEARERCRGLRDENCPYAQTRNGNNHLYQLCYAAHRARITQPGYQRLANPPSMTSLVCSVIAAQGESADESIYTAVNGHPRPRSQAVSLPAPNGRNQRPRTALKPGEAEQLLAELNRTSGSIAPPVAGKTPAVRQRRSATASRPPTKPAGSPDVHSSSYGGLPGFRIVSQDDKETVLRILPGADYYTVEKSFLAKDHQLDSVVVMTYAGNSRVQIFFPYRLTRGKIELYKPRLHLKGDDIKHRLGPMDGATREFISGCGKDVCEIRFALQAGETLRVPRKSVSHEAVSTAKDVPAAPAPPDNGTEGAIDRPLVPADATASAMTSATSGPVPVELETTSITPPASVDTQSPETVPESPTAGLAEDPATPSPQPAETDSALPDAGVPTPPPNETVDDVDIPFWAAIWTLGFGVIILGHRWYTKRGRKTPDADDKGKTEPPGLVPPGSPDSS